MNERDKYIIQLLHNWKSKMPQFKNKNKNRNKRLNYSRKHNKVVSKS